MALTAEEQRFADEIQRITGMKLSPEKSYLIEHRLRELSADGMSLANVVQQLRQNTDPALVDRVLDKILTHETSFFRDDYVFKTLTQKIVPEWMKRRGMDPMQPQDVRLKIWSCACSTGQEPYSIIMAIHEAFPFLTGNLQLIATDITEETLAKARLATYTDFEMTRGITPAMRDRYFEKTSGGYKMRETYSKHVTM